MAPLNRLTVYLDPPGSRGVPVRCAWEALSGSGQPLTAPPEPALDGIDVVVGVLHQDTF